MRAKIAALHFRYAAQRQCASAGRRDDAAEVHVFPTGTRPLRRLCSIRTQRARTSRLNHSRYVKRHRFAGRARDPEPANRRCARRLRDGHRCIAGKRDLEVVALTQHLKRQCPRIPTRHIGRRRRCGGWTGCDGYLVIGTASGQPQCTHDERDKSSRVIDAPPRNPRAPMQSKHQVRLTKIAVGLFRSNYFCGLRDTETVA